MRIGTPSRGQKPAKSKNILRENIKVVAIAFELGFIIALPIVLLGLAGKKLDEKYSTHFFVYIAIIIAVALTTIWIFRRFEGMLETLQNVQKSNPKSQDTAPSAQAPASGPDTNKDFREQKK